jgi:hypothetical protein
MSRSYWVLVFALVGLTSCQLPPWQRANQEQEQSTKAIQRALEEITGLLKDQAKPDVTTQPCKQSEDKRNSDLCAQWKAADAGSDAAKAAWLFGIFGCLIGGFTLVAAVKAAQYAKNAAEHTRRGADAAFEAVNLAQQALDETKATNVATTRPYVFFMGTDKPGSQFERDAKHSFAFKNYGQTPALNVNIQINYAIVKRPIGDFGVPLEGSKGIYGTIAPGAEVNDHLRNDLHVTEVGKIAAGEVFLLRMVITYDLPTGGSDHHDLTWWLDREGFANNDFRIITSDERDRQE